MGLPTLYRGKDNDDVSQIDRGNNRRCFISKNDEECIDFKNKTGSEQQVGPRSSVVESSLSQHVECAKDLILPTIIDDTAFDEEEKGFFTPPGSISNSMFMTSPPPIKETVLTQRLRNKF